MQNSRLLREAPTPPAVRCARTPFARTCQQEQIENRILDGLAELGPMTAGEIMWKLLPSSLRAKQRDAALESLVKRGLLVVESLRPDPARSGHRWLAFRQYAIPPRPTRRKGGEPCR